MEDPSAELVEMVVRGQWDVLQRFVSPGCLPEEELKIPLCAMAIKAIRIAGEWAAGVADKRAEVCDDAVRLIKAGKLYPNLPRDETAATENCARMEAEHIAAAIRKEFGVG